MTIHVILEPQTPVVPGQARLIIKNWQGGIDGLEFSVERNQEPCYLQKGEQWSATEVWFPITLRENENGNLEGLIGPDILDPILESSGTAAYIVHLQQQPNIGRDKGRVHVKSGLLASAADGITASTRQTADIVQPKAESAPIVPAAIVVPTVEPIVEPTVEPIVEPLIEPTVAPTPEPVVAPKPAKKGIKPLYIILPILLLAIAAGVAWILLNPAGGKSVSATDLPLVEEVVEVAEEVEAKETIEEKVEEVREQEVEPAVAAPIAAEEVVATAPDTSCSVAGLGNQSELSFVQNCIQQDMSSEQLLTVINGAKAAEQCGVAQRLYANRAQSGDVTIALAYAKEYDAKFHQANPCFAPDDATASYWYETVLAVDPDHSLAQERLEVLEQ